MEHRHSLQKLRHSRAGGERSDQRSTQLPFYWHQLPLLRKWRSGVGLPPTRE
jgi:hypothetical protein